MSKMMNSRFGWIFLLLAMVAINLIASQFHYRIDLTQEKRFTLSNATRSMLKNLDDQVQVDLFLAGDMPAGFKKLAKSTQEMLDDFKELSHNNVQYTTRKPLEGLNDSSRAYFMDSLQRLGLNPMNVQAQTKEGEGQEQRYIYPGAILTYKGRTTAVDLLQGQSSVDGINSLNNAEALLEYKLASAIHRLTQDSIPNLGYLLGNGEPFSYNVYDLIERNIKKNYGFAFLPIDSVPAIPAVFSALLIVKPTIPFNAEQKLKLDQYIMHGGKVMWMIDNLYAEMDSLTRSQNEFIAFDRGLNLEDQLFKYGARINQDLVQDLNCDRIPSVIGKMGDKPQIELLPWPYFPLLSNYANPITKNLDYILSEFPNSVDTVKADGIKKTFILNTGEASRILSTPARVAWNSVQNEEDARTFNKSLVPIGVLLEGKFNSCFANRLTKPLEESVRLTGQPFLSKAAADNKMIVIGDGDIALNSVNKDGPLQMGMNPYTKYKYANSEFVMNAIEYLVDNAGILETRGKDYTLRLLDKKKLEENKLKWQLLNIAAPIVFILLCGSGFQFLRRRRYES